VTSLIIFILQIGLVWLGYNYIRGTGYMSNDICNIALPSTLEDVTYSSELIAIFVRKKNALDRSCFPSDSVISDVNRMILLALDSVSCVLKMHHRFMAVMTGYICASIVNACMCKL
jgi:hypothetical protein